MTPEADQRAPPPSPLPPCVDLNAPGRSSDCPRYRHLCNDTVYYDLMTQQCPRTCNRCPDSAGNYPRPSNRFLYSFKT
ncbi:unnamed protein product [Gongylonema pulchrum]|uniref:ShKT domain-containing protein n=1 Tax=Gongylonema pulchrum TaxID=637853 RepID=A0A183D6X4_9BILA|nr:unnamed protein product [Gongylonema pulchrum]